ncbi:MAG: hypothetical protein ACREAC_12735, partial [Blastocatellia bacterium]
MLGTAGPLFWGLVVFLYQSTLRGDSVKNLPALLSFISGHKGTLAAGIILFAVSALYAHQRDQLQAIQEKVFCYKSTTALRPSDIVSSAAWYNDYFLPRSAVETAVDLLTSHRGVLLLGVPLIGKTRCAFEALKKLKGHHVLGLAPDNKTEDIKLPRSWIVRKPGLILLLDDIDRLVGRFTPDSLYKQLERQSRSVTVLATCRSGQEHKLIGRDQAFGSFVSLNMTEVRVEQLTKPEERIVASQFAAEWSPDKYNGTPGAIVLGIDKMRVRLDGANQDVKTLMRSLCLMRKAGIQTYRRILAEAAASNIFGGKALGVETDSAWLWLKGEAFLEVDGPRGVVSP